MKAVELRISESTSDLALYSVLMAHHNASTHLVAQPGFLDQVYSLHIMQRQLRARLSPQHLSRRDCTLPIHCDTAHDGSWTAPRNALQTHTPHFPYTTLKGFFHISDARVAVPKTVNVRLHAKLDAAEGMLIVMHVARDTAIKH